VTKSELVRRAITKYLAQIGEGRKFQSTPNLAVGLIGSGEAVPLISLRTQIWMTTAGDTAHLSTWAAISPQI
jgi:hypothetical protein